MRDVDRLALHAALRRRAAETPRRERWPFEVGGRTVGSVEPSDARLLAARVAGVALDDDCLVLLPRCAGDAAPAFEAIAIALRDAGRLGRWRDERLPVLADDGSVLGAIERATVRVLGLRTLSTHLCGCDPGGGIWVQRRAADKTVDPGLLDTLSGGLVSARREGAAWVAESLPEALARETWEEAGLRPHDYAPPVHAGTARVSRVLDDGYMSEDLVVHATTLAAGVVPENRDGEVDEFACLGAHEVLARIAGGEFTLEASLAILMCAQAGLVPGLAPG